MNQNPSMKKGVFYAVFSAFCFSTLIIFAKFGYQLGMSTRLMLLDRFLFGTLSIVVLLFFTNKSRLKASPKLLAKCAGIGMCFYVPQSFLFTATAQYISASLAALILYGYPLVVMILSVIILKKRLDRLSVIAVFIILAGCALVFIDAFSREANITGVIYAVSACMIFSAYIILAQIAMVGEKPTTVALYVSMFTGIGFFLIGSPAEFLQQNSSQVLFGVVFGFVTVAGAVVTLYKAIEYVGAAHASIFSSFEPAFTVLVAALLLNEAVIPAQIFGMILLILGVTLPNLNYIRKK